MTARNEVAAKITLLGFVLLFVIFFTLPHGPKPPKLGGMVPDFTLKKDNGKLLKLTDYRGKIVVLNFWASWCGPCVDEVPSLNQFAKRYAGKDVQVLGVSLDEDPAAYQKFLNKHQISFLTLRNPSHTVSDMYGTYKLPETYIISRDGHLLQKIIGPTNWMNNDMTSYVDGLLAGTGS